MVFTASFWYAVIILYTRVDKTKSFSKAGQSVRLNARTYSSFLFYFPLLFQQDSVAIMPFPWLIKMNSMFHYYSITLLQCKAARTDKFHSFSLAPHCNSFPTLCHTIRFRPFSLQTQLLHRGFGCRCTAGTGERECSRSWVLYQVRSTVILGIIVEYECACRCTEWKFGI